MEYFYAILVAFVLVFVSELGDKTQLLVISFSAKQKAITILMGVALGSFLSHGIAILFGSSLGLIQNEFLEKIIQEITHVSFILFGLIILLKKKTERKEENQKKRTFTKNC